MKRYKVVDLFAGAGGLSLGFKQTGRFSIVAAAENNKHARNTYQRNHKGTKLFDDVRDINYSEIKREFGNVDVVIGGPPCQGFSNANRQHSSIISTNNRLVKEYVRAICELEPSVFVMENVAMLNSDIHRFLVDEEDIKNDVIKKLTKKSEKIELLPASVNIPDVKEFVKDINNITKYSWGEKLFKVITVLYRYRINKDKFDDSLEKYNNFLKKSLKEYSNISEEETSEILIAERDMANAILNYINDNSIGFSNVMDLIEAPLFTQRMLRKMNELKENHIHIEQYIFNNNGSVTLTVQSYAVTDYIHGMLESKYKLTKKVLNAANFGAPQKRERFIIVGISKSLPKEYAPPKETVEDGKYATVRQAISDLEHIPVCYEMNDKPISLPEVPNDISELAKILRGKTLYNHISTATRKEAMERFKALKEGQNFHDLDPKLKTTYSNAERTQNTIYLRLKYDEPSGTVVNVRKSMWVHPKIDRAISIREAARLQTFPDSFVFEGSKDAQYQQVGNAVPPLLAKAIAKSLLKVLE